MSIRLIVSTILWVACGTETEAAVITAQMSRVRRRPNTGRIKASSGLEGVVLHLVGPGEGLMYGSVHTVRQHDG